MNRILSWKIKTGVYAYIYLPNSQTHISNRLTKDSDKWDEIIAVVSVLSEEEYKVKFNEMAKEVFDKYGLSIEYKDEFYECSQGTHGDVNIVVLAGEDGSGSSFNGGTDEGGGSSGGSSSEIYDEFNSYIDSILDNIREEEERKNEIFRANIESVVNTTVKEANAEINETIEELTLINERLRSDLSGATSAINKASELFNMGEAVTPEKIQNVLIDVGHHNEWLTSNSGNITSLLYDYDSLERELGSLGESTDVSKGYFSRMATSLNEAKKTVGTLEETMDASVGKIEQYGEWIDASANTITEGMRWMDLSAGTIGDMANYVYGDGTNSVSSLIDAKNGTILDEAKSYTDDQTISVYRSIDGVNARIDDVITMYDETEGTLKSLGESFDAISGNIETWMTIANELSGTARDLRDEWTEASGIVRSVSDLVVQTDEKGQHLGYIEIDGEKIDVFKNNEDGKWYVVGQIPLYAIEDSMVEKIIPYYSFNMGSYIRQTAEEAAMGVTNSSDVIASISASISGNSGFVKVVADQMIIDADMIVKAISAKTANIGGIVLDYGRIYSMAGEYKESASNNDYNLPSEVGDIAYWNGERVKTIKKDLYKTSMGTPIGVVVIPENFLPDGKARIISLNNLNTDGYCYFESPDPDDNTTFIDSDLVNYIKVASYINDEGYANFTTIYDTKDNGISPYTSENTLNPDYIEYRGINNCLNDINGLNNTQVLVGLGGIFKAANAAWKYKDGVSNVQWYLPSIGEFGFLPARVTYINTTITLLGGTEIKPETGLWSSTEYNPGAAWNIYFGSEEAIAANAGTVEPSSKLADYHVRPFAMIDSNVENGIDNGTFIPNFLLDGHNGKLIAKDAEITGKIIANEGSFSGSVYATSLYLGGGEEIEDYINSRMPEGDGYLVLGHEYKNQDGTMIKVETDGLLVAKNAVVSGTVYAENGYFAGELYANTGTIGGFTIEGDRLKAGSTHIVSTTNEEDYTIISGYEIHGDGETVLQKFYLSGTTDYDGEFIWVYSNDNHVSYYTLNNDGNFVEGTWRVIEYNESSYIIIADYSQFISPSTNKENCVKKYLKSPKNTENDDYYTYGTAKEKGFEPSYEFSNTSIKNNGSLYSRMLHAENGYFNGEINATGVFRGTLDMENCDIKSITANNIKSNNIDLDETFNSQYFNIINSAITQTYDYVLPSGGVKIDQSNNNNTGQGYIYTTFNAWTYKHDPIVLFKHKVNNGDIITIPQYNVIYSRFVPKERSVKSLEMRLYVSRPDGGEYDLFKRDVGGCTGKTTQSENITTSNYTFTANKNGTVYVYATFYVHLSDPKGSKKSKFKWDVNAQSNVRIKRAALEGLNVFNNGFSYQSPNKKYGIEITNDSVKLCSGGTWYNIFEQINSLKSEIALIKNSLPK